jgi:hypothetical protein
MTITLHANSITVEAHDADEMKLLRHHLTHLPRKYLELAPPHKITLDAVREFGPCSSATLRRKIGGKPSNSALTNRLNELARMGFITRDERVADDGFMWTAV